MKKLVLALCTVALLAVTAHAADTNAVSNVDKPKKHKMTAEQEATKKELTDKYDTNKDGKLDKDEMSKMSDDDKAKWKSIMPAHHKKSDASAGSSSSSSSSANDSTK
jgi:hypothetical protein